MTVTLYPNSAHALADALMCLNGEYDLLLFDEGCDTEYDAIRIEVIPENKAVCLALVHDDKKKQEEEKE